MSRPILPTLTCRKCGRVNPVVYLAPVIMVACYGTCICLPCARERGWLDQDGNLKPGITL